TTVRRLTTYTRRRGSFGFLAKASSHNTMTLVFPRPVGRSHALGKSCATKRSYNARCHGKAGLPVRVAKSSLKATVFPARVFCLLARPKRRGRHHRPRSCSAGRCGFNSCHHAPWATRGASGASAHVRSLIRHADLRSIHPGESLSTGTLC